MDYYFVCVCGREWWFDKKEVEGKENYCTECGEIMPVEEMTDESNEGMLFF